MKDYLSSENARNKLNAALYTKLLHRAFGPGTASCQVMIGHHLSVEANGDLDTEMEIPSADTMMFDHELMVRVFGSDMAMRTMVALAQTPVEHRDYVLQMSLDHLEGKHG